MRLLWDVCQVPDFRNVLTRDAHAAARPALPPPAPRRRAACPRTGSPARSHALDRADGDIDALLTRIAGIRTWTYVSNRDGWLPDAPHWQERTRAVEDRLSDALHERLTREFVDRARRGAGARGAGRAC